MASPAAKLLILPVCLSCCFVFVLAGWLKGLGAERLSVHLFPNPLILVVLTFSIGNEPNGETRGVGGGGLLLVGFCHVEKKKTP